MEIDDRTFALMVRQEQELRALIEHLTRENRRLVARLAEKDTR